MINNPLNLDLPFRGSPFVVVSRLACFCTAIPLTQQGHRSVLNTATIHNKFLKIIFDKCKI